MTEAALAPSHAYAARQQAARALDDLIRRALAHRWVIGVARGCAWLVVAGTSATIAIVARTGSSDAIVLSLLARAAGAIALLGGVGAIALSAPPKDGALSAAIAALGRARGLGDRDVARSELLGTMRTVGDIIALPLVGLCGIALVMGARMHPVRWLASVVGAAVFSILAALLLGGVAYGCRRSGGAAGRRWFLAIVLVPWILAEASSADGAGAWLSIPGALTRLWEALTAGGT